jgi:hypothetical protein
MRARADVVLASSACFEITIANPHGWPAHAEIWAFNLNNEATGVVGSPTPTEELTINPTMLAELLTGAGAIVNPAMTWLSSKNSFIIYLVQTEVYLVPAEPSIGMLFAPDEPGSDLSADNRIA